MKKYYTIVPFVALIIAGCTQENNCFQRKGNPTTMLVDLPPFSQIEIPMHISVQIVPSTHHQIEIHSHKNTIGLIHHWVQDDKLIIKNKATCTMLHTAEIAFVKIYTPTLSSIESKTQFQVFSQDTLRYPSLELRSSLPPNSGSTHFDLLVNNRYIYAEDNQVAKFDLKGKTHTLDLKLYGANATVQAKNLTADTVRIYHRSNQNIGIRPQKLLEGTIASVGNVYCYSTPKTVNIHTLYTGKCIFF